MRTLTLIGLPLFLAPGTPASAKDNPPTAWVRHQVSRGFSIELPADLQRKPVRGIDSEVAEFRGPGLVVSFDYGVYGARADCRRDAKNCVVSPVTIDGRSGHLAVRRWGHGEKIRMRFHVNLEVQRLYQPVRTAITLAATVDCRGAASCRRAPQILPTIRFTPPQATPVR